MAFSVTARVALNGKESIRVQYSKGDRVELIADYEVSLEAGHQGTVLNVTDGEKRERLSYVEFDNYGGGTRLVPNSKLKKI